jgi:hypothetical protein
MQKIILILIILNLVIAVNNNYKQKKQTAVSKELIEIYKEKLPRDKEILRLLQEWKKQKDKSHEN